MTDEIDKKTSEYNQGFLAGQEHKKSSPMTLELFKTMNDEIREIKNDVKDLLVHVAEMPKAIFKEADERYAGIITQRLMYGLVIMVLVAVTGSIVNSVVNKPDYEELNNMITNSIEQHIISN